MKPIFLLLLLLFTAGLYALEVSQVNPVAETTLNVQGFTPIFQNVESDGSLVFFDAVIGGTTITIRQVICSHEGIFSNIQDVITYTTPSAFIEFPTFVIGEQRDMFTYLYFDNTAQICIFKLPDNALDVFPTSHVFVNHGMSQINLEGRFALLGDFTYYTSTTDYYLYSMNLATDLQYIVTENILISSIWITLLGDDYLYIYSPFNNDHCFIMNKAGDISSPTINSQFYFYILNFTQQDIGEGVYPVIGNDGVTRNTFSGYIEYNNNQIRVAILNAQCEYPFPFLRQNSCIPLGSQRFICIETYDAVPYYQTYQFTNDQFVPDTNFPYFSSANNSNAQRLFKTSDRYIVGVSFPADNLRTFTCIDLQQQTIRTTLDSLAVSMSDYIYNVYYGANYIYYMYLNNIKIYAVERVTGASDDIQTPVITSIRSYPNPFRGSTEIVVKGADSKATTSIYNIKGQLVRKLISSENTATDMHFTWEGKDEQGKSTPAGIYLYRVDGNHKISGKMVKME